MVTLRISIACEPAHIFGQERENEKGKRVGRGGGFIFPPPPPKKMSRLAG